MVLRIALLLVENLEVVLPHEAFLSHQLHALRVGRVLLAAADFVRQVFTLNQEERDRSGQKLGYRPQQLDAVTDVFAPLNALEAELAYNVRLVVDALRHVVDYFELALEILRVCSDVQHLLNMGLV